MDWEPELFQRIAKARKVEERNWRLRRGTSRLFVACGRIMLNAGLITQAAIDKCKSVFIRFLFWAAMQGLL